MSSSSSTEFSLDFGFLFTTFPIPQPVAENSAAVPASLRFLEFFDPLRTFLATSATSFIKVCVARRGVMLESAPSAAESAERTALAAGVLGSVFPPASTILFDVAALVLSSKSALSASNRLSIKSFFAFSAFLSTKASAFATGSSSSSIFSDILSCTFSSISFSSSSSPFFLVEPLDKAASIISSEIVLSSLSLPPRAVPRRPDFFTFSPFDSTTSPTLITGLPAAVVVASDTGLDSVVGLADSDFNLTIPSDMLSSFSKSFILRVFVESFTPSFLSVTTPCPVSS